MRKSKTQEPKVNLRTKVEQINREATTLRKRLNPESEEYKMIEKLQYLVLEAYHEREDALHELWSYLEPDDSDCFI